MHDPSRTRRSTLPHSSPLEGGLAVHKDAIAVAYVAKAHEAAVIDLGPIGTRQGDLDQLVRTLQANAPHLVCVEAAGPCGDGLSRSLPQKGYDCGGVAPSRIPTKAGDRITTDRRDAVQWARLRRSGALTPAYVPTVAAEAMRDLSRARAATLHDLTTAKCRLNACRLRQDSRSTGRATWGPAPLRWLREVVWPTPAQPSVFHAEVRAGTEHTERRQRLAQARHEHVNTWRLSPVVEALQALRGVQWTVAITPIAERGDLTRFDNPRPLLKDPGLLPSDYASGARRRQGSITNAGNTHARRALLEGAWADRDPAHVSRHLQLRLAQPPNAIQDLSWKAPVRLCQRDRRLMARGKHANPVVGAMARERAGFLGAIATQVPRPPSSQPMSASGPRLQTGCHGDRKRRSPGGVPPSTA
jgi:transposase